MPTAFISGASRGIGRAIATKLAAKGYDLGVLARSEDELLQLSKNIKAQYPVKISYSACDIANVDQSRQALAAVSAAVGAPDVVICNAGVGSFKSTETTTIEDWDLQMDVNARGSFLLVNSTIKTMTERQKGHIIFITSDAATRTFPNGGAYCASKYAQYAFANALRKEVRSKGVKVSVILPGLVASTFNGGVEGDERKRDWLAPSDVADAVEYVLSAPNNVVIDEIMLHPISQDW